jgi:hypothetical protein
MLLEDKVIMDFTGLNTVNAKMGKILVKNG